MQYKKSTHGNTTARPTNPIAIIMIGIYTTYTP